MTSTNQAETTVATVSTSRQVTMTPATIWVIRVGVGLVAVCAAVISFDHVRRFALSHGENELTSVLLPLGLEGAIAGGAAAVLGWDRTSGRRPVMAWLLLLLGLTGSLAGNVAAATTTPGRVGAAFPPLLLLLGVEVLAGLTRPQRAQLTAEPQAPVVHQLDNPEPADPEPKAVRPEPKKPQTVIRSVTSAASDRPETRPALARSAEEVMREAWDAAIADGRLPTGTELAQAAGVNPTYGRKFRRKWETEPAAQAIASTPANDADARRAA